MIYIETARLQLRDWKATDIDPFVRLNADEQVMRYFPKTLLPEETYALYKTIRTAFHEYGFGLYAVEEKQSGAFIGFIGFQHAQFEADFTPCIEIGWRLKKEVWGKGYATEGATACLQYGFTALNLQDVYSFTAEVNAPSKSVMQKIGMNFMKTFEHPNVHQDSWLRQHVLFHASRRSFTLSNEQV
ncbi:GNAT family N-acetyltransferase [Virgibacillus sp. NKC19-3]|uniref:GNAT family N-acetyltransferase n=1 Tax=Virgibacillus saliphilus TaxID=2831674 RepID=UPI001C9B70DE|nr:GNAT family N-acetyltransferase [Virgibacillus sp. NKC19-3]MBY7143916.1 GNAT family N-acetyltransferase [Virgibacillus sp. NKC19-3]